MASIYTYNILSPLAASGADVSLVNSNFKITGAPFINNKQAISGLLLDPITEVREVVTLTPTAATGVQVYSIRITQFVKTLGRNVSKVFSYSAASGDSATTISAAFIAMINLDRELALTATGTATVVLTAASGSSDMIVTLISLGSGLTAATTFVNVAGSAVTTATLTTPFLSQTAAGLPNNVGTLTSTSTNLANGMVVRYTLASTDSFTFHDGTVVNTVGATVDLIIGNVSGTSFDIGPLYDSRLEFFTLGTASARTVSPVATPGRGLGSELASRGVVGATAATTYAEVRIIWNDAPTTGGTPIQKQHSVFVDTTTSSVNYGTFRYKLINALQGTTSSTSTFNTAATPESASVI
jgi:hypothetical protein